MRTHRCHKTLVGLCCGIFKDSLDHQVTAQNISHHGKLQRLVEYLGGAGDTGALDARLDITGGSPAGIDDHGDVSSVSVRLEPHGHFVAIQSRQLDVHQNKIRSNAGCLIDGVLTRGAFEDFMAQAFEKGPKGGSKGVITIDNQYFFVGALHDD